MVFTSILDAPQINEREILRYAGCKSSDESINELMQSVISEVEGKLEYKVCYCRLALNVSADTCNFGSFEIRSADLAKNLSGCRSALIFGATLGVEIDRMISRYGYISPARAVMLQAAGAERIEALCSAFCKQYAENNGILLRPRFSAGYGDLSLEMQRDIFLLLVCSRHIGLTLTDSLLMSPSKSVTAIAGIEEKYDI